MVLIDFHRINEYVKRNFFLWFLWGLIGIVVGILVHLESDASIVVLVCIIWLFTLTIMYITQGGIRFTPAWLFFMAYTLILIPGSIVFWLETGRVKVMMLSAIGLVCYSFGVLYTTAFLFFRPRMEVLRFAKRDWEDRLHSPLGNIGTISLSFAGLLMSISLFLLVGIPLLAKQTEAVRLRAITQTTYLFPLSNLLLFLSIILFNLKARIYGKWWRIGSLVLWFFAAFYFLGTAFRSLILQLLLLWILLLHLERIKLKWRLLIVVGVIFIIAFVGITWSRYKYGFQQKTFGNLLPFALKAIEHRILLVNVMNVEQILLFFNNYDYLYGSGFLMDAKALAPGHDLAFSGWMTAQVNPRLAGISGMTPTVIGELFANFGLGGVVLGMFMLGNIIQFMYVWFLRGRKEVSKVAFFLFLTLYTPWIATGGLGPFVFSKFLIITAIMVMLLAMANIGRVLYSEGTGKEGKMDDKVHCDFSC